MAEAGTEMPIPTATAMPVQQQTPIATATAMPVQQQRPIATAWSRPGYENCGVIQNGCEPTTCDGDTAPWCNIKNPGCDDEVDGGGWAYCTTDSASSGSLQ